MSHQVSLFILNVEDFSIEDIERVSGGFNLNLDKTSKTYREKLFSQFIRYFIFAEYFNLSRLKFSTNHSNKPYLENYSDKHFSISHSGNKIIMAVSSVDIGVDTEIIQPRKNIFSVAKRYFSEYETDVLGGSKNIEKEFYKLWTLKEAEVKRNSIGIAHGLAKATFTKKNESWASENYPADFVSYFFENSFISICSENIISSKIRVFKVRNDFCFEDISSKLKSN
ncbi:4'-phosphopantetheinyl transferase superfamily protein [Francisella sp. Scap27]|uniref:4'-phosphopantetheinyl transferase family protein n=1 Tax=Francisella sp. Scap27 TaxID=2589986 RepID=UPI0015B89564|nr:4'-phosphopantetheinyl transferase superfamily protein [Francisella sp. Scap27]QLE79415.1 4'-phosphopantetheinyl transferase superfamily protein [Francisella sp. Scap27]